MREPAAILVILALLAGTGSAARAASPLPGAGAGASLTGTTGLVNVPTADVLPDGVLRFGYHRIDKRWVYDPRGVMDNEIYFLGLGFLPRLEVMVRATEFPHGKLIPQEEGPTVDRMASARVQLLRDGEFDARMPAVAVGADDPRGTRRFHSLYVVATKRIELSRTGIGLGLTGGYGSTALSARRYVLDGGFGGAELTISSSVAGILEYDTEKWNTSVRMALFGHLGVHLALLNLDTLSGGVTWTLPL